MSQSPQPIFGQGIELTNPAFLKDLQAIYPKVDIKDVINAANEKRMETWHEAQDLLESVVTVIPITHLIPVVSHSQNMDVQYLYFEAAFVVSDDVESLHTVTFEEAASTLATTLYAFLLQGDAGIEWVDKLETLVANYLEIVTDCDFS